MAKINAVIFDCWSTVIHYHENEETPGIELLLDVCDNPDHVQAKQIQDFFHNLMDEYYLRMNDFDVRFTAIFNYVCKANNLTPRVSLEEIEDMYERHLSPTPVENLDKVISFLKSKGITIGVCSNTIHSEEHTKEFIKSCWPDMPFDFVMASSNYAVKKPNKRFFDLGAKLAGTTNDKAIYVGDDFFHDVYGSYEAGYAKSIWYNPYGRTKSFYTERYPYMNPDVKHKEIKDYLELVEILKGLI